MDGRLRSRVRLILDMDPQVIRHLIRRKLEEGRLPRHRIPRVRGGAGDGGVCDGCGMIITKDQTAVEGMTLKSRRVLLFHAFCFELWDDERPAARNSMKQGHQLRDAADALVCEAAASLVEIRRAMRTARKRWSS